ncbi:MAG: hybrid sensor histidine kinase/response regulator [Desulfobacterales bacterium]|nr:hybrid sensor histidine kinase/response regulator [Desulfobacterales bacterium]
MKHFIKFFCFLLVLEGFQIYLFYISYEEIKNKALAEINILITFLAYLYFAFRAFIISKEEEKRKKIEIELNEKAQALKLSNESKQRFISHVSHEIRTPINSILGLSKMLLDGIDGKLTNEQEKQVKFIQKSSENLSQIINNLLDEAKLEAGKIEVHINTFEISELFNTLKGMIKPLITSPYVEIIFQEPDNIPSLKTDENIVTQILRNLISNAIKFTEKGEIKISVSNNNNMIIFSVSDTGIGISEEDQKRIFEDYVQIPNPLQKKFKGTGLGLSISKKLSELVGGSISVQSKLNEGSTFKLIIPIEIKILIIDSNVENMILYKKSFKDSPFKIIPCYDLKDAAHIVKQNMPKAVIVDILLGEKYILEFIKEIKKTDRKMPIFLTGNSVLNLEIADCFTKPLNCKLIQNRLKEVIKHENSSN